MLQKTIKRIRYYFLSGAAEGLLALIVLFLIPADPKNVWLLGYSKARWVSAAGLFLVATGFGWLGWGFGKKERDSRFVHALRDTIWRYPIFGPAMLLAYGLAMFVPYSVVTYPVLTTWQGVQVRIAPVMLYVLTRLIHTMVLWVMIASQRRRNPITEGEEQWIPINPRKVAVMLAWVAGLLVLTSATLDWIDTFVGGQQFWGFRVKFDLDQETNVPSYFSAMILLMTAFLLGIIGTLKGRMKNAFARHWQGLALIFLFMSIDESAALHERLINIFRNWLRPTGFFYYGWVIAAIPLIILLGIIYLKFFFQLPPRFKWYFSLAGVFYVTGAMGMEMVGGRLASLFGENHAWDNVLVTIEEALEMFAIIFLIYSLLRYIEENFAKTGFLVHSS